MERLQTWWVTALYVPIDGDSCMEIPGDCEVVKATDAQATIATLQAELERTKFEMASELELQVNAVVREREQLKAKLTQRTAELEAAKEKAAEQGRYAVEMFDEVKRVQAELERQTKVNREMNAYWQGKLDGAENSLAGLRKGRA